MRDRILMLTLSTTVLACGEEPLEGDMLAIGDSILEWNAEEGASIPDAIGAELGVSMANASVSGSQVLGGEAAIPDQYQAGGWSWVVMDGGGNDLNDRCACGSCAEELDAILSADGRSGALASFVREVLSDGIPVVYVGYFDMPPTADFGFAACQDELEDFRTRLRALEAEQQAFLFIDPSEVISADELEYYEEDHVHPSEEGVEVAGAYVAEVVGG